MTITPLFREELSPDVRHRTDGIGERLDDLRHAADEVAIVGELHEQLLDALVRLRFHMQRAGAGDELAVPDGMYRYLEVLIGLDDIEADLETMRRARRGE